MPSGDSAPVKGRGAPMRIAALSASASDMAADAKTASAMTAGAQAASLGRDARRNGRDSLMQSTDGLQKPIVVSSGHTPKNSEFHESHMPDRIQYGSAFCQDNRGRHAFPTVTGVDFVGIPWAKPAFFCCGGNCGGSFQECRGIGKKFQSV